MDRLTEHRRILTLAAANELPEAIDTNSDIPVSIVRELCDAGLLDAIDARSFDGDEFLRPQITMRGRIYLADLERSPQTDAKTNVGSYGQYGGITANTVNIHHGTSEPGTAPPNRVRLVVGGSLAAAAAIVAVLEFLGVGPLNLFASSERPSNRSTAVVRTRAREITDSQGESIKQQIPIGSKVTVGSILNDPEAIAFANQIRDWLVNHGHPDIASVAMIDGLPETARGVVVLPRGAGVLVFVGARLPDDIE